MKSCTSCGVMHPLTDFSPDRRCVDGRQSRCKLCRSSYQRKLRQSQPETSREISRRSYKKHADKRRAAASFEYHARPEYHKARNTEWAKKNRKRINDWRRDWLRDNPQQRAKCNAGTMAWRRAHPEDSKERAARYYALTEGNKDCSFSIDQWLQLVDAYDGACAYCGQDEQPLTRDHMVPVSRGGDHGIENIVPSCQRCNSSKNNRTPLEWFLWKAA